MERKILFNANGLSLKYGSVSVGKVLKLSLDKFHHLIYVLLHTFMRLRPSSSADFEQRIEKKVIELELLALRSLSFRLFLAFVAIIVITTLLTGVPAYLEIRAELDRQAWSHVSDGGRVTLALLATEKNRLADQAVLVAQRPTLRNLVQKGDFETLNEYLQTFQATVDLDILAVTDPSGRTLAKGSEFPFLGAPYPQETTYRILLGESPQLALLASQVIPMDADQEFYITVGIVLNNDFARKLAAETCFEYSFLIGENRVSTTLAGAPADGATDVVRRVITSEMMQTAHLNIQDSTYYLALVPLFGANEEVIGLAEVILPIENLLEANRTALLVLIFSAFLVILAASGFASYLARRLTAPLKNLTESAVKIGQGDLNTPVPIPDSPSEIKALAASFEKSREATLLLLDDLSQAKAWSETLIQSVVEGIATVDSDGKVTSFNQGAEQITGWTSVEVVGMPINQVFPLVENDDDFRQHISSLPGNVQRVNVKTRKGGEVTLAVTNAPLRSPKDESYQTALVIRDISEEEKARRLHSYFLSNISHEFRTPLSALNASVELLLEDIEELSLAEIAELLKSIHLSVTGLQTLIDNLLESTSIEAGHFRIRRKSIDLGDVVTNALQVMKPLLERRRQHLSLTLPAQIPYASADATRLTQVLVNLLSNASKYSPMESTIELCLKKADIKILHFSVSDQGPGIPTTQRSKLYQRFSRLDEPDSAQYGIGLGLSVVKTIVEAHAGEVGMEERPGGGSIFWFTIPCGEVM